jgi:two-component system OmpR family sensor kinase
VETDSIARDQYFDIPALVRAIADDARMEADRAGVAIQTNVENDEPEASVTEPERTAVKGDAELLRRAVENVLRNAIRFSARGKTVSITVTTDSAASLYSIQVADEGPGVPPEALGRIFDPFVRVAGLPATPGFGLGLAIARRAVLAHRGTIQARNRPAGGLEVTLNVPVAEALSS